MHPPIGLISLAILADGAAALVAALLPEDALRRHRPALMGFATGVLVGTSLLDLLPAAWDRASAVVVAAAVVSTAAVMAVVERALARLGRNPGRRIAGTLLAADGLHNATDGAAIAAAFLVSARLGLVTSLAVIAHELPEELADYVVLRGSALRRRSALVAMTLIQLTAAIGAAVTLFLSAGWRGGSSLTLAIGAGTFLYIGLVDLAPDLFRGPAGPARGQALAGLMLGLALIVAEVLF